MNLSADQQSAVEKLNRLKVGALFMRPGTGKTRTAIELIKSSPTDWVLFIAPFRTKTNLAKEIDKWGLNKPYRIEGVESLSSSDRLYLELLEEIKRHDSPFMVVDESLKIKNQNAIRTKRILAISIYAKFKLVLNGTPVSKNLLDLWTQMEFLSPKILKMNQQEFKNTFCHYIRYRKANAWGGVGKWQEFIKNYENLPYLYSLIEPFIFDADLHINKTKQYIQIPYDIDEKFEEYQEIKDQFIDSLSYDPDSYIKAVQAIQHSYCDEPNKLKAIGKIIDDKTLIFTKFIRSQEAIKLEFPRANVISYGTGSYGLNLQQYNKIIFFDKTFDYAQRDQAEHRIYRMGQKDDVTYYDLTGSVNLEKTIDRNIEYKSNLLDEFKLLISGGETNWEKII